MQLQKVVGIDPSMWPYRVHVRHALSSMQLQKVVGIDPSMWPYRVHVRHALSSMQLQKVVGIDHLCGRIEYTFVMLYHPCNYKR